MLCKVFVSPIAYLYGETSYAQCLVKKHSVNLVCNTLLRSSVTVRCRDHTLFTDCVEEGNPTFARFLTNAVVQYKLNHSVSNQNGDFVTKIIMFVTKIMNLLTKMVFCNENSDVCNENNDFTNQNGYFITKIAT